MDESYEGMSAFLKYLYTDEIDDVDVKVLVGNIPSYFVWYFNLNFSSP